MTNKHVMWLLASAIAGGLLVTGGLLSLTVNSDAHALGSASLSCVRSDQCEAVPPQGIFAEPQNTLSNLMYLFAGLCVLVRAFRPGFSVARVPALMVAVSFCFLALMSGYYHATLNDIARAGTLPQCLSDDPRWPQKLDIVGVYLALTSIVLYGLDRLLRKRIELRPFNVAAIGIAIVVAVLCWIVPSRGADPNSHPALTGISIWLVCGLWGAMIAAFAVWPPQSWVVWLAWCAMLLVNALFSGLMRVKFGFDSDLVFPVLVGMLLSVTALNLLLPDAGNGNHYSAGELLLVLSAFTIGIVMRVLDGAPHKDGVITEHPLCSPHAVLQAHAMWHVMSGLALLLTYELIERATVSQPGTALLPEQGSLMTWLGQPGDVLGRSPGALFFNIGFSIVTFFFGLVMLVNFGAHSVSVLVPLGTAVYFWVATYAMAPPAAGSRR
jgi:hypothetical protein